ncbi:MAG: PEP-CTERM sorting domain-containing protein [Planctomycetota bacterium]
MMKKFLIFILVIGLASLAVASPDTLQISVHTDPPGGETWDPDNPQDSEIWLLPSETLFLDVYTTAEIYSEGGLEGYWLLGVSSTMGSISGGFVAPPWGGEPVTIFDGGDPYLPPGETGVFGSIGTFLAQGSGITGRIYDGITFTCEGQGDAVVNLYTTDFATPTLIDSVIIHQVPEPMTIMLLGLGGLLLRRRG